MIAIDQNGDIEAKGLDTLRDLTDLFFGVLSRVPGLEFQVGDFSPHELGQPLPDSGPHLSVARWGSRSPRHNASRFTFNLRQRNQGPGRVSGASRAQATNSRINRVRGSKVRVFSPGYFSANARKSLSWLISSC